MSQYMPSPLWDADQVARWLGFTSGDQLLRIRARLIDEFDFPDPVPGIARVRWSALALAAWQASLIPVEHRQALAHMGVAFPMEHLHGEGIVMGTMEPSLRAENLDGLIRSRMRRAEDAA